MSDAPGDWGHGDWEVGDHPIVKEIANLRAENARLREALAAARAALTSIHEATVGSSRRSASQLRQTLRWIRHHAKATLESTKHHETPSPPPNTEGAP